MQCENQIISNDYNDYILNFSMEETGTIDPKLCYLNIDNLYNIVYLSREKYPNLMEDFMEFQNIPKLYGLMQEEREIFDSRALSDSGILSIQKMPLSLKGKGILIAIIDTGINFADKLFINEDGKSKILSIWDQTAQSDVNKAPKDFAYGLEYTWEQINEAILDENPYHKLPSRDTNGHGTRMAALAAGNATSYGYTGAAPLASLIVVKLKEAKQYLRDYYLVDTNEPCFQENDIMLAVKYCDRFARINQMPLVICLGIGTNMGDHSGNNDLAKYLNYVSNKRERAVVVCGGNEGNSAHHYAGTTKNGPRNVEIRVGENNPGFTLEFWGDLPDVYTLMIRSPGGETVSPITLTSGQNITYDFIYEKTKINVISNLVEASSGKQFYRIRMRAPTAGIWIFQIGYKYPVQNGNFQMYLPISTFLLSPVYFLTPDPEITLTEPSLASDVISVTSYNAATNGYAIDSGRGYSSDGRIRPDFAAPGVDVFTPTGRASGSSLAAAITAGAVALFLEWAVIEGNRPNVRGREMQSYFIRGANRQNTLSYPNREWGYGTLNLQGVFDRLRG